MPAPARAGNGDEFTFDYRHYDEGERDLAGQTYRDLNLKPIEVDSLAVSTSAALSDRLRFGLDYTQDTWSGATPVVTVPVTAISDQIFSGASSPLAYYSDADHNPVTVDWTSYNGNTVDFTRDPRSVHVMASASPETRRQVDLKLDYEWSRSTLNVGGGVSDEPDYLSKFINMGGTWDLNQKLSTINWGWSYTRSKIDASLEANIAADWGAYTNQIVEANGINRLRGDRKDLSFNVGLTQILGKNSLLEGSLGYTHSSGYLSNPYKALMLAFDDPDQFLDSTGLRTVILKGTLEQRPTRRDQWTLNMRYVKYVEGLDASLHANYRFYHDDWGIDAHTLDLAWYQPIGGGWMVVPGARYYTQLKAEFYQPYYFFNMAYPAIPGPIIPGVGRPLDHGKLPLDTFASDQRLSAYGTFSGQLAVSKQLSRGARFEIGAEYFTHAGSLKLGGGGEGSYADFDSYMLYAELNVDLSAPALAGETGGDDGVSGAAGGNGGYDSFRDPGVHAPAGVIRYQLLDEPGAFMIGYHHAFDIQDGGMLHGSTSVGDQSVIDNACGSGLCSVTTTGMDSHINLFDFSYAPTAWLTLVLEAQFVDKDMNLHPLEGAPLPAAGINRPGLRQSYTRTTSGIGDTGIYGLIGLWNAGGQQLNAGLGITAPTGSVHRRLSGSGEFMNYGVQPGSGTLDLRPSLSYTGEMQRCSWGAQLSGVKRLEGSNDSGYALGDLLQVTAWGSYDLFDWLSGSVRGVYTTQGAVRGEFDPHRVPQITGYKLVGTQFVPVYGFDLQPNTVSGPMDAPANYGGQRWDIGFGLSAGVPGGELKGNRISVEWLQPVSEDVHGYQLAHTGTLILSWGLAF